MGKIRARSTKVCTFCKKRKVKCDLAKPFCSNCVKYKQTQCVYSDIEPTTTSTSSDNQSLTNSLSNGPEYLHRNSSNSTMSTINSKNGSIGSVFSSLSRTTTNSNENGNLFTNQQYTIEEQPHPTIPPPSQVHDELSFLKQKLQDLENKFHNQQQITTTSPHLLGNSISNQSSPNISYSPRSTLLTLVDTDSLLGYNPYESENDLFSFFDGYNPTHEKEPFRKKNYGPLSWVTMLKIDAAISSVWVEMGNLKKQMKERGFVHGFQITDQSAQVDKDFSEKAYDDEGNNDLKPFKDFKPVTKSKFVLSQEKINEKALSLGLSFYKGGLDTEVELVEKIRLVLPKQKVIWMLFKRFFSHLYVAMPIIDEMVLKEDLQHLIGLEDYQDIDVVVKIEKKLDFATLGVLLIILRFSYISLFSQDSTINEINFQTNDPTKQQIKFLLNNPINLDVIDVAKLCLDQFNIYRGCNLTLLQLALLTRLYNYYAPEAGDGIDGGDAQVFNATLVQMAMSIGLHREPNKFKDAHNDDKLNNLGRKIWYYLLIQDMNNAMADGTPCAVRFTSFDTKPPYYRPGNENVLDVEVEKVACGCFPKFDNVYEPMSETFDLFFAVKNSINMGELSNRLNYLENHFKEKYQNIATNYNDPDQVSTKDLMPSTIKLKIYFTSNFFLVTIYLFLYNFYEKRNNLQLQYFYLKKMVVIIVYEIMPFFVECITHKKNMFKSAVDLVATPSFLTAAHKSVIVLTAIYLRLKFWVRNCEKTYNHITKLRSQDGNDNNYKLHFQKLLNLVDMTSKSLDIFRDGIGRLSHRYYYAWRVTKAQNFLRSSFNDEFFANYSPIFHSQVLDIDMLGQLEHIFETSIKKVHKLKKQHKQQQQEPNNNLFEQPPPLKKNSISSSTSSDNEYQKPNDQVDSIWLQMMNLKNDNNFNLKFQDPIGNTMNSIINPSTPTYMNNLSFSPPNFNFPQQQQQQQAGPFANQQQQQFQVDFNNYFNDKDMFENFPLDELLKDF
ncbi:hypothetical protein KGF54_005552 [Candida jiufengensis]|uniref:uncharacterized protein n=1 Tax=Candida jiufengensis TaxID=497108 RepID=UPI002225A97D|nr:uncharacterized protein KGF54_005552 [Candida jiufengensis]KAI5949317.1 hypothetical protein KGF54_005552 [Candida jiufengensis]